MTSFGRRVSDNLSRGRTRVTGQLICADMNFGDTEPAPVAQVSDRQRQEEEELARVLELSKQDRGGRYTSAQPSSTGGGGSSSAYTAPITSNSRPQPQPQAQLQAQSHSHSQPAYSAPPPAPEPQPVLDLHTATRVRALYTFTSAEVGELNFERGDVIKVLDRGFQEWWRGACNGKIGVSYRCDNFDPGLGPGRY
jgi:signal transducing adaptor molecule